MQTNIAFGVGQSDIRIKIKAELLIENDCVGGPSKLEVTQLISLLYRLSFNYSRLTA